MDKFSLANLLVDPHSFVNMTYLKEALDNVELVYRCLTGDIYLGMSLAVRDFLRSNVRILSTREFGFVRSVFEAAYIRFQTELR